MSTNWSRERNLISVDSLGKELDSPNIVVVDCRSDLVDRGLGLRQYLDGHIPGAVFASLDDDLADPPGSRGRHPLPSKQRFRDCLGKWGISNESHVISYDAQNSMFACRLWWMMRWMGHERVSVLDGGFAAWTNAAMPTSTDVTSRTPCDFEAREQLTRTVGVEDVANHTGILLDARARDRFHGQNETVDHTAGRIPNAVNSPFLENVNEDGRFLRDTHKFETISKEADVICYCGSGVTAAHNILALLLAGYDEPALYPGSWSEWIENSDRPIAT